MLYLVIFITWATAVFTNIYIYKLLYGGNSCILSSTSPFKTIFFIIIAPLVSILLFIKFIIRNSCELSQLILADNKKTCSKCANYDGLRCSVYDLAIRKDMLCKGELYNDKIYKVLKTIS